MRASATSSRWPITRISSRPAGAVGNATAASAEKGEAALAYGARAFVELLGEVDRFDLSRLEQGPLG